MAQDRLLNITKKELDYLHTTAENCSSLGAGLAEEADEALAAYESVLRRAKDNNNSKHLQITCDELIALIETADSCQAIGWDLAPDAKVAVRAYQAVLKRNHVVLENDEKTSPVRVPNLIR